MSVQLLRRIGLLVALTITLAACGGSSSSPPTAGSESSKAAAANTKNDQTTSGNGSPDGTATSADDATGAASADSGTRTDPARDGDTPDTDGAHDTSEPASPAPPTGVITSVNPNCVGRPDTAQAIIESAPFADVAYGAAFADGQSHGQYGLGQADAEGRFVWNIAIPADAATGMLRLTVGAASVEHDEGGEGSAEILVTAGGECP